MRIGTFELHLRAEGPARALAGWPSGAGSAGGFLGVEVSVSGGTTRDEARLHEVVRRALPIAASRIDARHRGSHVELDELGVEIDFDPSWSDEEGVERVTGQIVRAVLARA